jgi:arylsulfatase
LILLLVNIDSFHFIFAKLLLPHISPYVSVFYVMAIAVLQVGLYGWIRGRIHFRTLLRNRWFFISIGALVGVSTIINYEAVAFIDRNKERPFFLYLAYNAPHWPLNAKWDDFQKYKGKYTGGWKQLMARRLAKQKELGLFPHDITPAPHVGPDWNSLKKKQRDDLDSIMAAYAGCIDSIDQNIGKLTRHLESLGERNNTLIFFLSDNGACQEGGVLGKGSSAMVKNPPLETTAGVRLGLAWANACNTPFRLYKHFVHEGGACTPMIASWPAGIAKSDGGKFVRQSAYLPDFMATCVDLAAATYPADVPPCQGNSLAPLLKGSSASIHRDPIYWEHEGNAAVRWGDWKLVREYKKPWELYNIATDRTELNDLSQSHASRRSEMIGIWEKWATKNQVAFPERFNMYEFLKKPLAHRLQLFEPLNPRSLYVLIF